MSDAEDPDNATAMAAAMGFSSFGAQQPNKRRKFNPNTDAFVAPSSSVTSTSNSALHFHQHNEGNGHTATTGSNTVPLGVRKKNMDEIDLDDDDVVEQLPSTGQTTQPATADDEDPEPQYIDTSRPSAPVIADPADPLQSKIDAIVGSSKEIYTAPQLPPTYVASGGYSSQASHGGRQHNMNRDGRSGPKWWEDYYDPTFIMNPWDELEKVHGLEPRGTWISWEDAKAART
ncbi:hypothetical protein F5B22DRAFT_124188 [Xylaria bambusicola]|uniref:uncharacterized protein n=1 Tax=Xylaria bambusicola TaxID=326684 RepID=UPI0020085868|nr:uncharacterized protein F5B22DRAFT_124188 [Xylaria bambusicola]KAI0517413.1 hypothetical protein F5B22DRAFT_124188 [Xylaria bambusicola]